VTSTLAGYAAGSWRERGLGDIVVPGRVVRVVRVAHPRTMCIATLLARGQVTSHVSNQSLSKASPPSPGILETHQLDKRELSAPKLGRFDPYSFFHFAFAFTCEMRFQNFKVDRRSKYESAFRRGWQWHADCSEDQRGDLGRSGIRGSANGVCRSVRCLFFPSRLSRAWTATGPVREAWPHRGKLLYIGMLGTRVSPRFSNTASRR
jgi:hypothetical protein